MSGFGGRDWTTPFAAAPSVFDMDSSGQRSDRSGSTARAAETTPPSVRYVDQLAAGIMGIANLFTELAITHPCVVLRRQCQVHQSARSLHFTPFTLIPVVTNIISKEGMRSLWKGAVGNAVVQGLSMVTEVVIAEVFSLPRSVVPQGSSQKYMKYVLLKASNTVVMTPFTVAAFIETVRSGTNSEGVFEVLQNGIARLRFDFFSHKDSSRRFSIAYLTIPTLVCRTGHFLVAEMTYGMVHSLARRYVTNKPENKRTPFDQFMPALFAQAASNAIADLVCYPLETVLNRLYIQGTRTLIDNLDTGLSAVSINVKYTGFLHCFRSIVKNESAWALYSGLGALILQYGLHFCVLHATRKIYEYTVTMIQPQQTRSLLPSAPASTVPLPHSQSYGGYDTYRSPFGMYPTLPPSSGAGDIFELNR